MSPSHGYPLCITQARDLLSTAVKAPYVLKRMLIFRLAKWRAETSLDHSLVPSVGFLASAFSSESFSDDCAVEVL